MSGRLKRSWWSSIGSKFPWPRDVRWLFAAVAVAGLFSLRPSCSTQALLDLRTQQVTFRVGDGSSGDPREVELGIGFPLEHLTISGVDRIRYREVDFSAANQQGEATELRLGEEGKPPGVVQAIIVRTGATVTMSFDGRFFCLSVDPGPDPVELAVDAPAGWRLPTGAAGESAYLGLGPEEPAPTVLTLSSRTVLSLTGELDPEATRHSLKLGFQRGLPASAVRVSDAGRGALQSSSYLLAGKIHFVNLKDRAEQLWLGERVSTVRDAGHLLLVECVPAGATDSGAPAHGEHAAPSTTHTDEPHLRVVWMGEVSGARAGQPGAMRNVMPAMLTNALGSRELSEYLAIMTSLLAFIALLLHHGVKETLEMKDAQHERTAE